MRAIIYGLSFGLLLASCKTSKPSSDTQIVDDSKQFHVKTVNTDFLSYYDALDYWVTPELVANPSSDSGVPVPTLRPAHIGIVRKGFKIDQKEIENDSVSQKHHVEEQISKSQKIPRYDYLFYSILLIILLCLSVWLIVKKR